jgi:hypothetical protein
VVSIRKHKYTFKPELVWTQSGCDAKSNFKSEMDGGVDRV